MITITYRSVDTGDLTLVRGDTYSGISFTGDLASGIHQLEFCNTVFSGIYDGTSSEFVISGTGDMRLGKHELRYYVLQDDSKITLIDGSVTLV